jgi:pyridoxamine 5'-phosphate oxidase family protein
VSVFTEAGIAYLQSQRLGRLATVGPDGRPHVGPGFDPQMFRIRPARLVSWGLEGDAFAANARSVP